MKKKAKEKKRVLESAKELSDARDEIINFFDKGIFPYKDKTFKTKEKEESEEELKENKFFKHIENESKDISYELFRKHFNFVAPTVLAKELFETKDKNKNNDFKTQSRVDYNYLLDLPDGSYSIADTQDYF